VSYEPDFTYTNHGSVWTIRAASQEAKEFAERHFVVEDWQGARDYFTADWRPAKRLIERLRDDEGFLVEDVSGT
jgi:hypothetical protein